MLREQGPAEDGTHKLCIKQKAEVSRVKLRKLLQRKGAQAAVVGPRGRDGEIQSQAVTGSHREQREHERFSTLSPRFKRSVLS